MSLSKIGHINVTNPFKVFGTMHLVHRKCLIPLSSYYHYYGCLEGCSSALWGQDISYSSHCSDPALFLQTFFFKCKATSKYNSLKNVLAQFVVQKMGSESGRSGLLNPHPATYQLQHWTNDLISWYLGFVVCSLVIMVIYIHAFQFAKSQDRRVDYRPTRDFM